MIRLTLILLAGIVVTLSIAGRDIAATETAQDPDVARAETDLTDARPAGLALEDEAGAIARALSASTAERAATGTRDAPRLWQTTTAAPEGADAVSGAQGAAARVNADRVNLRAGPSTANQVLDQVVRDQRVEVLETTEDGWTRIHVFESGLEAWIFGRFLSPLG